MGYPLLALRRFALCRISCSRKPCSRPGRISPLVHLLIRFRVTPSSFARPAAVPRGAASKYDRRRSTSSWVFSLLFGEATLFALFRWATAAVGLTQMGDTGKREMVKVALLITDYEHPATDQRAFRRGNCNREPVIAGHHKGAESFCA